MIPEEHIIHSAAGTYSRKIWLTEAADGKPSYLAIFLDGEYYVNRMNTPAVLQALQAQGALPSMVCVFVSHVDGAARHQDLTCNTAFAEFIAHDVVQWVRQRHPQLSEGDHSIIGPSLGGLASAFITLSFPQVFSGCVSHSGSFWWNGEWLTTHLDHLPISGGKFWLSVGDKETEAGVSHAPTGLRQEVCQIDACERFTSALTQRNHPVHYRVYEGGHELKPWQDELPDALMWLGGFVTQPPRTPVAKSASCAT